MERVEKLTSPADSSSPSPSPSPTFFSSSSSELSTTPGCFFPAGLALALVVVLAMVFWFSERTQNETKRRRDQSALRSFLEREKRSNETFLAAAAVVADFFLPPVAATFALGLGPGLALVLPVLVLDPAG